MTPRPPLNIAGLTREELTEVVRDLEKTCNTQDAGIHAAVVREGRLFLDNRAMKEALETIHASDCCNPDVCGIWVARPEGGRRCIHIVAKEVLEKVKEKKA